MANENLFKGFLLGVAVAAAIPALMRSAKGRTLGKAALRSGEIFVDKAQELAAELGEIAEDALAEWQQSQLGEAASDGAEATERAAAAETAAKRSA